MTKLILASLIILFLCPMALAKTKVVAVIDTGAYAPAIKHLCHFGHKDFAHNTNFPDDTHGHGTHIASIIENTVGQGDYCIVAISYYSSAAPGSINLKNMIRAVQYAVDLNVDFINISGGGPESDRDEKTAIQKALDKGIKVVVAAGNDNHDISLPEFKYYPASYDKRLIVVGNYDTQGHRAPSSNYGGTTNRWEIGTEVRANVPCSVINRGAGVCFGKMTGTSQATAIATGKLIKQTLSE